jgi:hypothetical protein
MRASAVFLVVGVALVVGVFLWKKLCCDATAFVAELRDGKWSVTGFSVANEPLPAPWDTKHAAVLWALLACDEVTTPAKSLPVGVGIRRMDGKGRDETIWIYECGWAVTLAETHVFTFSDDKSGEREYAALMAAFQRGMEEKTKSGPGLGTLDGTP